MKITGWISDLAKKHGRTLDLFLSAVLLTGITFLLQTFATIAYVDAKYDGLASIMATMAVDARDTRRNMWELASRNGVKVEGPKPTELHEADLLGSRKPASE